MGRRLLLSGALGALTTVAACGGPEGRVALAGDPHAELACVECHRGGLADGGPADVPDDACTRCHGSPARGRVTLESVSFEHGDHGATGAVAVGCASCHGHAGGDEPITAGAETCGLCHHVELSESRGEGCRTCHASPTHEGRTSQGVAVPHAGLPWIEGGCLRCHYEVAHPVHDVPLERCATCHRDVPSIMQAGIGEDLHPQHTGTSCAACHDADNHRIEAMSSAVDLVCSQCHAREHGVDLARVDVPAATCNRCHAEVHQGPQKLLLGIADGGSAAAPSSHFMTGLTCRSCHVARRGASGSAPLRGSAAACVACHRPEYATVLTWWRQGTAERAALVERYLASAERAVDGLAPGAPASLAAMRGRELLALVRGGRGVHNLELSQALLESAAAAAGDAFRLSGPAAPAPPALGRPPREGFCTYCHYRLSELGLTEQMDDAFHREVLGRR